MLLLMTDIDRRHQAIHGERGMSLVELLVGMFVLSS